VNLVQFAIECFLCMRQVQWAVLNDDETPFVKRQIECFLCMQQVQECHHSVFRSILRHHGKLRWQIVGLWWWHCFWRLRCRGSPGGHEACWQLCAKIRQKLTLHCAAETSETLHVPSDVCIQSAAVSVNFHPSLSSYPCRPMTESRL